MTRPAALRAAGVAARRHAALMHMRRRLLRRFRRAPPMLQLLAGAAVVAAVWLVVNGVFQVLRKPSELFFPVSHALYKVPADTWRAYGALFERHSTRVMAPDLLAALAQVEGAGNPVARTYWRFSLTSEPFEMWRPASSAVGMYQITNGTFAGARRYCIHDHAVAVDGPWHAWRSCWFNGLYTRTVPSHAVELTSAYLDHGVAQMVVLRPGMKPTLQQLQDAAAMIHLCGPGVAGAYARRGFTPSPGQRCGEHDVRNYLARVNEMRRVFRRLRVAD